MSFSLYYNYNNLVLGHMLFKNIFYLKYNKIILYFFKSPKNTKNILI